MSSDECGEEIMLSEDSADFSEIVIDEARRAAICSCVDALLKPIPWAVLRKRAWKLLPFLTKRVHAFLKEIVPLPQDVAILVLYYAQVNDIVEELLSAHLDAENIPYITGPQVLLLNPPEQAPVPGKRYQPVYAMVLKSTDLAHTSQCNTLTTLHGLRCTSLAEYQGFMRENVPGGVAKHESLTFEVWGSNEFPVIEFWCSSHAKLEMDVRWQQAKKELGFSFHPRIQWVEID